MPRQFDVDSLFLNPMRWERYLLVHSDQSTIVQMMQCVICRPFVSIETRSGVNDLRLLLFSSVVIEHQLFPM